MKKMIVAALLLSSCNMVTAMTLEGSVEKFAVLEAPKVAEPELPKPERPSVEGHIGIRVSASGNIGYVHPGSPAEQVGLRKDDHIMLVDGKKHAIDQISGAAGTTVQLQVKRHHEVFVLDVPRIDIFSIRP